MTVNLCKPDLTELEAWAESVVEAANGWAERAEVSRGERKELTKHLDAIASRARYIARIAAALNARLRTEKIMNPESTPPRPLLTHELDQRQIERDTKLRRAGYFPWGTNAWIHRDDEGRVMTTVEALAELHNAGR